MIEGRREMAEYASEEVDPEATQEFATEVLEGAKVAPSAEAAPSTETTGGDE
jgi:hypothetical protein